jgi:hypothetical protein
VIRRWRERKRQLASEAARRRADAALTQWLEDEHALLEMIRYTREFHGEVLRHDPAWHLQLRPRERALASMAGAALLDFHRAPTTFVGGYSGASFRLAKGIRFNVGGTRGVAVPGDLELTMSDTGVIWLTDQRIVFQGQRGSREWSFSKLIALQHHPSATVTMLPVTNRQKLSGFAYDEAHAAEIRFRLEHALAIHHGTTDEFVRVLEADLAEHRAVRPPGGASGAPHALEVGAAPRRSLPLKASRETRTSSTKLWLVRTTNPGFPVCRELGLVAVDFHVRLDVSDCDEAEIKRRSPGVRAQHARELAMFAEHIAPGDHIVTKHDGRYLSGVVTGPYRFDPDLVADHPHVRDVRWDEDGASADEVAAVTSKRYSPYATVVHLGEAPVEAGGRSSGTADE